MIDPQHKWNTWYAPQILGFFLTAFLTVGLYLSVTDHAIARPVFILTFTAVIAIFQLIFFMHIGVEEPPRWNLILFLFMVVLIVIVIGGSLWIMSNLNYNTMYPT